jgi:preprotein translocase subunit Sec63
MMNPQLLNLGEITQKYRILGLGFDATKDDVRHARNKLLLHFHPDKHPTGWVSDEIAPEKRVSLIQNAYLYIIDNYDEIMKVLSFLPESSLTNMTPVKSKSYWVYTTIDSYHNKNEGE